MNHPSIAPYGAYPFSQKAEQHVVLSIQNEREWQLFCSLVLEMPELLEDEKGVTRRDSWGAVPAVGESNERLRSEFESPC